MAESLEERLRAVLEKRGWSPHEWAKRAGLTGSYVSNMLARGSKRPGAEAIAKLAEAAGISDRWLLTGIGAPEDSDTQVPPSTVPDDAPPVNASVAGWEDAARLARRIDPSIPEAAFARAARRGNLLTNAHPSPELVLQLARLAFRFPDDELMAQIRAEDAAENDRLRRAHDEHAEKGTPIAAEIDQDELTAAGRKRRAEGKVPLTPRTYKGAKSKPAENDGGKK